MSGWDSVAPWIAKIAPLIGTALGGPLGGAAGALLSNALGAKDASPDTIKGMIQSGSLTGDQIVALKAAEDQFSLQMAAMNIKSVQDLQNLAFEDRASARDRETKVKDWTPKILAYGVTIGFFGLLAYMLKHEIPSTSKDVLNLMLGSLGTAWVSIISYYFGASHTDTDTKQMLYDSTPGAQK